MLCSYPLFFLVDRAAKRQPGNASTNRWSEMTQQEPNRVARLPGSNVVGTLLALCEPVVEDLGFECVHIEFNSGAAKRRGILRVFIDGSEGVTIDDCARISRELDVLLDVEGLVPGASYSLEVSSPGLNRPLSKLADFERYRGENVAIHTRVPLENQRRWRGVLDGLSGSSVLLTVDGSQKSIPVDQIKKANVQYAFEAKRKKGQQR